MKVIDLCSEGDWKGWKSIFLLNAHEQKETNTGLQNGTLITSQSSNGSYRLQFEKDYDDSLQNVKPPNRNWALIKFSVILYSNLEQQEENLDMLTFCLDATFP